MIGDLRAILEDWEYEPGTISVRKIVGQDGLEKIQTRVDLGLLQLEVDGRPDGLRPHGFASLLDYHAYRLSERHQNGGDEDDFTLSASQCRELRHEGYLYYQRYLSMFVLEEFDAVERDTRRSLHLMDFLHAYAAEEGDREALEPQRPYVMMMNARARANRLRETGEIEDAYDVVADGLREVGALLESQADEAADSSRSEIRLLEELRDRLLTELPDRGAVRLRIELDEALSAEDYERAAELRDQLATAGVRP